MAQVDTTVEVTLGDFGDDEIQAEYEARGLGDDANDFEDELAEIRDCIARGDTSYALILIDRLMPTRPDFKLPMRSAA